MRPGHIRLAWLNRGKPTIVPDLTLGEQLDLMQMEVAVLRKIGLRDNLPKWEQEKLGEIASVMYVSEYAYTRLAKADAALTREAFEVSVATKPALLALSGVLAQADRELRPDFRRAARRSGRLPAIGDWLRNAWRRLGRTR